MIFTHTISSKASIKKAKFYDFTEGGLTSSMLEEGRKRTSDNPLLVQGKAVVFKLYSWEGKLKVYVLHSFDGFEEVTEKDAVLGVQEPREGGGK